MFRACRYVSQVEHFTERSAKCDKLDAISALAGRNDVYRDVLLLVMRDTRVPADLRHLIGVGLRIRATPKTPVGLISPPGGRRWLSTLAFLMITIGPWAVMFLLLWSRW